MGYSSRLKALFSTTALTLGLFSTAFVLFPMTSLAESKDAKPVVTTTTTTDDPHVQQVPFTDPQKAQIEQIIHDYLLEHPEILLEVGKALQMRQQEALQQEARTMIAEHAAEIFNDGTSPIAGNPQGTITLVEFFDYQCAHCKTLDPSINKLIKNYPDLKVVFKTLPVFGDNSVYVAKAAIAAVKQSKYYAFHEALMRSKKPLNPIVVMTIAEEIGLDTKQLAKDLQHPDTEAEIKRVTELADALRVSFTPAMIIAPTIPNQPELISKYSYFIPGSVDYNVLSNIIKKVQSDLPTKTIADQEPHA